MPIRLTEDQLPICDSEYLDLSNTYHVQALQHLLYRMNYEYNNPPIEIDGIFGAKTKSLAIKSLGTYKLQKCQVENIALQYFGRDSYQMILSMLSEANPEPGTNQPIEPIEIKSTGYSGLLFLAIIIFVISKRGQ